MRTPKRSLRANNAGCSLKALTAYGCHAAVGAPDPTWLMISSLIVSLRLSFCRSLSAPKLRSKCSTRSSALVLRLSPTTCRYTLWGGMERFVVMDQGRCACLWVHGHGKAEVPGCHSAGEEK